MQLIMKKNIRKQNTTKQALFINTVIATNNNNKNREFVLFCSKHNSEHTQILTNLQTIIITTTTNNYNEKERQKKTNGSYWCLLPK